MTKKLIPLIVVAALIVVILGVFTILGWDNLAADLKYQYLDNYDEKTNSSSISWYIGLDSDITIPRKIYDVNITKIGGTFSKAHPDRLTSVTMNDNIVEIDSNAFSWGCVNLTNVTFSNKLTKIGNNAFNGCTALRSVTIPDGVQDIGATTFANCTALTSVSLPDSVTSIDATAFNGSENVVVTYKGNSYDYEHIADLVALTAA